MTPNIYSSNTYRPEVRTRRYLSVLLKSYADTPTADLVDDLLNLGNLDGYKIVARRTAIRFELLKRGVL